MFCVLFFSDIVKYICPDEPGADLFDFKPNDHSDLLLQEATLSDASLYSEAKQETDTLHEQSLLTPQVKQETNLFSLNSETLLGSLTGRKEPSLNISHLSSAQQLQQAALKLQAQQQKQAQQQQLLQLLLQQQQQQQQEQQKLSLTTQQLKLLLLEYQNRLTQQQQQQQSLQLQSTLPVIGQAQTNNVVTLQTLQQVGMVVKECLVKLKG